MTKTRPPVSFELALSKIAGLIGWEQIAAICKRSQRAVRNWGDKDATECIRIDQALALDVAYRQAGGDGAPILETYVLLLEQEALKASFCTEALARAASVAAKEGGEATAALIQASRPGASRADREIARRETQEAIEGFTSALAQLGTEGDQ